MLKGKNLYYVLGIGAVAYYFWWMNKKKKDDAAKVLIAPAPANFTGDLSVPEYQNAYGVRRAPYTGQNFDFSQGNYISNPYKNTYRGR
jgi:hypothetical protein